MSNAAAAVRSAARRLRPTGAVPAIRRHVLNATQSDPHSAGRHAGGESLLGRAIAQLDDHGVAKQNGTEGAELVMNGSGELAEFQGLSLRV